MGCKVSINIISAESLCDCFKDYMLFKPIKDKFLVIVKYFCRSKIRPL